MKDKNFDDGPASSKMSAQNELPPGENLIMRGVSEHLSERSIQHRCFGPIPCYDLWTHHVLISGVANLNVVIYFMRGGYIRVVATVPSSEPKEYARPIAEIVLDPTDPTMFDTLDSFIASHRPLQ